MKKVLIILGIILLIIIIGFLGFYLFKKGRVEAPPVLEYPELKECENFTGNKRDECYIKIAVEKNKGLLCNQIENVEIKDKCYLKIAINLEKDSLCERVSDNNKVSLCKAVISKDYKLCENLRSLKDNCYAAIATLLAKSSLCGKIEDKILKEQCNNMYTKRMAGITPLKSTELRKKWVFYILMLQN